MDTAIRARAVAAPAALPIDDPGALVDTEIELAEPGPHDLLVQVRAVSVNPADVKRRASLPAAGGPRVLGFDAAGVVVGAGSEVSEFAVGDEVYYAGSDDGEPGSDAELELVDERIVGHKPTSLDFAEAAALPLTTITAWEALFDKLALHRGSSGALLVLAGAGGVGSMVIQLARQLTGLTVIATASRPESARWARHLGAHHVVDHHDLAAEVRAVAPGGVDYIFTPFSTGNIEAFADLLKPQGSVVAIDEPRGLDLLPLKPKSLTWHWESMFTRPLYEPESTYQRDLLDRVSGLVDSGILATTMTTRLTPLDAVTLREAHRRVESSGMVGKVVVAVAG